VADKRGEALTLPQFRQKFAKLLQRIDALSLRERFFVLGAMLLVVAGAWEALLATPLEARETLASNKVATMRGRLQELDQSMTIVADGIGNGMEGHLDRMRVLRQQVAAGEESVRIFTSDLVDPGQMRFVLEDLIRRQTGLRLISASNLPGRPLIEEPVDERGSAPTTKGATTNGPTLYRHGLRLVLEGAYLDLLAYLESVERLPWQLYWGSLQLETEQHPRSRITIELHTLSLEEEWIGV
jgi:MSHA biogenesis protein MshJ